MSSLLQIDIRTVLILLFVANLLAATLLLAYFQQNILKKRYVLFLTSKILQALAWALLSMRANASVSTVFSFYIANALLFIGFALESICFLIVNEGRNPRLEWFYALLAGGGTAILWTLGDNPASQVYIASLVVLAIFLSTAIFMLQRPDQSRLYRLIAIYYLSFAIVMAMRAWTHIGGSGADGGLLDGGIIQALTFLSLFGFLFVSDFGFVLLAKEAADETLRIAALHDHLTGILNRRAFYHNATLLLRSAHHNKKPVSVMMLDIDFFKRINDEHGHATGDLVLKGVSERARHALRDRDIFGRLGGEEFAILMQAPQNVAADVAERLRKAIEDLTFEAAPKVRCTISIGRYTCVPGGEDELSAFLETADAALYKAKNSGRNRVQEAEEPTAA